MLESYRSVEAKDKRAIDFAAIVIAYFMPKGTEVFREYCKLGKFNISEKLEIELVAAEERKKAYEEELKKAKVKL